FRVEVRNPDGSAGAAPDGYAAGASFYLDITYDPAEGAAHAAEVTIRSNDPLQPVRVVAATGGGLLEPCVFSVQPVELFFGAVRPGAEATLAFGILNEGAQDCF